VYDPGDADDRRDEGNDAEKPVSESHRQRPRVILGVVAPASPEGDALAIAS
jgi:hypothetical protein